MKPSNTPYQTARVIDVTEQNELVVKLTEGDATFRIEATADLGFRDEVLLHIKDGKARFVKKVERRTAPTFTARFIDDRDGGKLMTIEKGRNMAWAIKEKPFPLETGDLVTAEALEAPRGRRDVRRVYARVISKLGNIKDKHVFSSLAIQEYDLRDAFDQHVLEEAEQARAQDCKREDFTGLNFITIDPHDARDHDDAIFVETTDKGWRLYVAIADVAAFVRPGTLLDQEAQMRGNSVYFPDRVVPMLPDILSGDACSLHEDVERPVIFTAMEIDQNGQKTSHRFGRANIRSRSSMAYETAQAIEDGEETNTPAPIHAQVKELFKCYREMAKASHKRGALHLELPESKVILSEDGSVQDIAERERLDAHKLVEEAMVMANVAAAESLEHAKHTLLYRIHEIPKPEKVDVLRKIAKGVGYKMANTANVSIDAINQLLDRAAGTDAAEHVSMQVLRTMRQARYAPRNAGHFGLALKRYAHFTSPIRRYADLVVHRALIAALELGKDGASYDYDELDAMSDHISDAERTAMQAERDCIDRYSALYMSDHIGAEMKGKVSGLTKAGLFIKIGTMQADGFAPVRMMSDDHYNFDRLGGVLRGQRTKRSFKMGQEVLVKIFDADPITGGIELQVIEHQGEKLETRNTRKSRSNFKGKKSAKKRSKRKS